MTTEVSPALSIRRFIDKIGKSKGDHRRMAKAIADAFGVEEQTPEFQFLIYTQTDNFYRLLTQLSLSSIGKDARKNYKRQVEALAQIVNHNYLLKQHEQVAAELIEPNRGILIYLQDALSLKVTIDDASKAQIADIADQLQGALDDALSSDLPLKVKSLLQVQIGRLIFLLKNYEIAGEDQAWEQASAAVLTLHREAPTVSGDKGKSSFAKLAVILSATVGLLTTVNAGLEQGKGIITRLKEGYELIEQWKRTPRLRDLSKEPGPEE